MDLDIRRAQHGDERAFTRIVERLTPSLYRFAARFARDCQRAEDIVQEAWLRAYRALDRYDPERPFLPWLYRIASNLAISEARRRKRRPEVALAKTEPPSGRPDAAAVYEVGQRRASVRAAVDRLPPKYRAVCVLYYLKDMDLADVAEALSIPVGTAKVQLYRARAILRGRLGHLLAGGAEGQAAAGGAA